MPNQTTSFDFLEEYVLKLFEENDLNLSDAQKNIYVPQVMMHVEQRLGLELMPKLKDEQMKEFADLANKETSQEEWKEFWYRAVPTFEEDVKKILITYNLYHIKIIC